VAGQNAPFTRNTAAWPDPLPADRCADRKRNFTFQFVHRQDAVHVGGHPTVSRP
jgi:hypothetical protein